MNMDIGDKIYNAVPWLCDWLAGMSFWHLVALVVITVGLCFAVYAALCVHFGIVVEPADDEPYEDWMDAELWEQCRRERV